LSEGCEINETNYAESQDLEVNNNQSYDIRRGYGGNIESEI
jgi:hypothetical protein